MEFMASKGFAALLCIEVCDENDGNDEEGEAGEEKEAVAPYSALLTLSFNVVAVFLAASAAKSGNKRLNGIAENVGYALKGTLVGNQHKERAEHEYHAGDSERIAENAVALGGGGGF